MENKSRGTWSQTGVETLDISRLLLPSPTTGLELAGTQMSHKGLISDNQMG